MLKKIIPFILVFCLLFATSVMAEDVQMGRGGRPGGTPPEGFNPGNGEFAPPENFDPSQMPDFGNSTPPEGFKPKDGEFAPAENAEVPGTENTEKKEETPAEVQEGNTPSVDNGQVNNGMPGKQGGNMFNMQNQQQNLQEQPTGFKLLLQKYFTPAVSVLLLILAFAFVIFYKRKQY